MPVIDTRKRKPAEPSALEQLARVSAQQLNSFNNSYDLPTEEMSDMSDSGSDHSGDVLLRRLRRPAARRAAANTLFQLGDAGSDVSSDDDAPLASSSHKRRRVRDNGALDTLLEVTNRRDSTDGALDTWCLDSTQEEIRRLETTLANLLGRASLRNTLPTDRRPQVMMVESLRAIHATVRSLQSVITNPVGTDDLTRRALDLVWHQAQEARERELQTKLSFWTYKAQELRGKLARSLGAPSASAAPSDSTIEALKGALEFVSTFYLLDVPAGVTISHDSIAKESSITRACNAISEQLRQRALERLRELPIAEIPASSWRQRPPPVDLATMNSSSLRNDRSPLDTIRSMNSLFDRSARNQDGSEDDEPLSVTSRNLRNVSASMLTAALRAVPTPSRTPPPPTAKSPSKPTTLGEMDGLPQSTTRSFAPAVRDRLHDFINGQLQSKTPNVAPSQQNPLLPLASGTASQRQPQGHKGPKPVPLAPAPLRKATTSRDVVPAPPVSVGKAKKPSSSANRPASATRVPPPPVEPLTPIDAVVATTNGHVESEPSPAASASGCAACGRTDSPESILLCDNDCGREYHALCLNPPVVDIPEGDWYCPKCLEAEGIQAGALMYKCSHLGCDKITASKYCGQHRCKIPACMNVVHAIGYCRKHRESQRGRPGSASESVEATAAVPAKKTFAKPALTVLAKPGTSKSLVSTTKSPSAARGTTPESGGSAKPSPSMKETASKMLGMGIFLPPYLVEAMNSSANTPTAPSNLPAAPKLKKIAASRLAKPSQKQAPVRR